MRGKGMPESLAHLSPAGELVNGQTPTSSATNTQDCGISFVLGPADYAGGGECETASEDTLIFTRDMCQKAVDAAVAAGIHDATAGAGHNAPFSMDDDSIYKDNHPRGCFKMKTTNVFYYNPVGYKPDPTTSHENKSWTLHDDLGGFPVCTRARYLNGTISGQVTNCPSNYVTIDNPSDTSMGPPIDMNSKLAIDNCRTAAQCLTYAIQEDQFTVGAPPPVQTNCYPNPLADGTPGNGCPEEPHDPREPWACEYDYMPKGCFIRERDHKVYFNDPRSTDPSKPGCTVSGSEKCSSYCPNRRRQYNPRRRRAQPGESADGPDDPTGVETPLCMAAKWYGSNPAITVTNNGVTKTITR